MKISSRIEEFVAQKVKSALPEWENYKEIKKKINAEQKEIVEIQRKIIDQAAKYILEQLQAAGITAITRSWQNRGKPLTENELAAEILDNTNMELYRNYHPNDVRELFSTANQLCNNVTRNVLANLELGGTIKELDSIINTCITGKE